MSPMSARVILATIVVRELFLTPRTGQSDSGRDGGN
jgi:hypothetical protein